MKWEKIVKEFKDEWVLIEAKKVDKNFNLIEGEVIVHSKDKSEIYEKLIKLKNKSLYIEYTGKIPEDLAVVLYCEDIETGKTWPAFDDKSFRRREKWQRISKATGRYRLCLYYSVPGDIGIY